LFNIIVIVIREKEDTKRRCEKKKKKRKRKKSNKFTISGKVEQRYSVTKQSPHVIDPGGKID